MSGTDQLFTKLAISRSLYNLEPSNGIPGGNLMKVTILLSVTRALKCKTLGGILRCRLTNALSRQLALLAEPKNTLDSTMSTSSGFFVHTMKHCYATALYTTEAQALSITRARISLPHACNHERSIRKECGK